VLFNRFKEHLDRQFKSLPDSREASDFREELLGNLMSRAMELKEDKSLTDDEIYHSCIDSLGDYSDTLKKLASNPIHALRDKRFLRDVLFMLTFALIAVAVYIAVSFGTGEWGLAAIIVFPAMAGIIYIYATAKVILSNTMLNRHALTGLIIGSYTVLITLVAFFVTAFATPVGPAKAWVLFPFIPFFLCASSAFTFVYFRKKKIPMAIILFGLSWLSVAAYLLVAVITGLWHPTWLIALGGPIVALVAAIVGITQKIDNQSR